MSHRCPAPDCTRTVPSHMYACSTHWYMLPIAIRREIWAAYRDEPLSERHMAAMTAADDWLKVLR